MNRWIVAVLAAVTAVVHAAPSELSLRKLLEAAKANPGSRVIVMHMRGDDWEGTLTEVGADVFCVAADMPAGSSVRPEQCYAISGIARIGRIETRSNKEFTPIWVTGPG